MQNSVNALSPVYTVTYRNNAVQQQKGTDVIHQLQLSAEGVILPTYVIIMGALITTTWMRLNLNLACPY